MDDGGKIVIDLAGQQFRISPPGGDASRLTRAAALVSEKVKSMERAGAAATSRSALLAALELALELLQVRESPAGLSRHDVAASHDQIAGMIARLDEALTLNETHEVTRWLCPRQPARR